MSPSKKLGRHSRLRAKLARFLQRLEAMRGLAKSREASQTAGRLLGLCEAPQVCAGSHKALRGELL
jgi:hypothetical protein